MVQPRAKLNPADLFKRDQGRVAVFSCRGGSISLRGQVPSLKDFWGSNLFSQNESWVTDAMSKISKFVKNLGLSAPEVSLRTGAWHPLSKFSGCPGTRGTRTAAAPVKQLLKMLSTKTRKTIRIWLLFIWLLKEVILKCANTSWKICKIQRTKIPTIMMEM